MNANHAQHAVDVFLDDRTLRWGWQCFTCSDEIGGFLAMVTAETSAQQHRTDWWRVVDAEATL